MAPVIQTQGEAGGSPIQYTLKQEDALPHSPARHGAITSAGSKEES